MSGRFGAGNRNWQRCCLLLPLVALLLSACGSDKPEPTPVPLVAPAPAAPKLALSIIASPFINPDPDGRPSPMALRIYTLADPAPFAGVAMIDLFNDDKKALGDSLIGTRQEILIEPGGVKNLTLTLDPKAKVLAVAGGFRQFRDAEWRSMVKLDGEKSPLRLDVGALKVTLLTLNPDNSTTKNELSR